MALADIPRGQPPRRLDSWKEIAEYLNRDVRTATRWESQGLPVHRVAGKGRSVFAFTDEIDAWMLANPGESAAAAVPPPDTTASVPVETQPATPPSVPWRHRLGLPAIAALGGLAAVAVGAAVAWPGAFASPDVTGVEVTTAGGQVSIARPGGAARPVYHFDAGAVLVGPPPARIEDLDADGAPEILAGVGYYKTEPEVPDRAGELLDLSIDGTVRWRFAFDDEVPFASQTASGAWVITDWRVDRTAAPGRVAVAAHEPKWWASLVSVLDHHGRRLGTFVHSGWVESLAWMSGERLAIAGYNNLRKEAMVALLDVNKFDGQAPGNRGTEFECASCASAEPVYYATFARSELNRLTGNGFNRELVAVLNDRLLVTTTEVNRERYDATAFYEFDRTMRLVGARYSDSYWDEHLRLELAGRLTHSREKCPDRDGPTAIHVWDAARGWVKTSLSAGQ